MGKQYGYARVSTDVQVVDLQVDALMRAGVGCDDIYSDMAVSGAKDAMGRPAFAALMGKVEHGDIIVVYALSRLGRSTVDVLETLRGLELRGVAFRSVTESIDTSTPMGRMVLTILAAMAQMEREQTAERSKAGVAAARARGARVGRPPVADDKKRALKALIASGMGAEQAGAQLGLSRASAFRIARAE